MFEYFTPSQPPAEEPVDDFEGVTIKVARYSDDGTTTLGIMTIQDEFYCYTLEDTFRKEKVPGKTRIPAGTYTVDFNITEPPTPKTLQYREIYGDLFTWHLHVKEVPGFQGIYIHHGNTHDHTLGCILVSKSLSVIAKDPEIDTDDQKSLSSSRDSFRVLYKYLKEQLENKIPVRLIILDEDWLNTLN